MHGPGHSLPVRSLEHWVALHPPLEAVGSGEYLARIIYVRVIAVLHLENYCVSVYITCFCLSACLQQRDTVAQR